MIHDHMWTEVIEASMSWTEVIEASECIKDDSSETGGKKTKKTEFCYPKLRFKRQPLSI